MACEYGAFDCLKLRSASPPDADLPCDVKFLGREMLMQLQIVTELEAAMVKLEGLGEHLAAAKLASAIDVLKFHPESNQTMSDFDPIDKE